MDCWNSTLSIFLPSNGYILHYTLIGLYSSIANETCESIFIVFFYIYSVLWLDSGYTVKFSPPPLGVPSSFALKNFLWQRASFYRSSLVLSEYLKYLFPSLLFSFLRSVIMKVSNKKKLKFNTPEQSHSIERRKHWDDKLCFIRPSTTCWAKRSGDIWAINLIWEETSDFDGKLKKSHCPYTLIVGYQNILLEIKCN